MANYTKDHLTISGPAEDIDTIISTYSSEQDWYGDKNGLLLDGAKIFPYPDSIDPSDDMGSPRALWRRDYWGCPAGRTGSVGSG